MLPFETKHDKSEPTNLLSGANHQQSQTTLPPVVISLPLKLMLFVIVDGWHLIVSSLVQTYHV
ncbi:MAG: hypothetical protein GYA55_01580 [SAR324 cluster bacterium]|uniref:Flagellar biosynthetic protein FliP n=1 Tax=SAR324 cluster bacterium TaxID=2024889 RepID=A0A7X9FPB3_9DELT|nr:hypothetical protein [SAR324 cluster bacterium]